MFFDKNENSISLAFFQILAVALTKKIRLLFLLFNFNLSRIEDCAHGFKQSFLHVPKVDLTAVEVALPMQNEQQRLIEYSSLIGTMVENSMAEKHKLQSLKTALMQDLLTGKMRVTDLPDLPQI